MFDISDYEKIFTVEFSFICRKDVPEILVERVMKYMNALLDLFISDLELAGIATVNITTLDYMDGIFGDTKIKGMALTATLTY